MSKNSNEVVRLNDAPKGQINAAAVRNLFSQIAKNLKTTETLPGSVSSIPHSEHTLTFVYEGMSISMNILNLNM